MIICAAIKIQMDNVEHRTIVPCRRHGDGFKIIKDLVQSRTAFKEIAQGFIDDKGNFLDRKEALIHAIKCGQLSQTHRWYREDHNINELYSEDLY
jgi:hypothetical protein